MTASGSTIYTDSEGATTTTTTALPCRVLFYINIYRIINIYTLNSNRHPMQTIFETNKGNLHNTVIPSKKQEDTMNN